MVRDERQGFDWAERTIGGRIIRKHKHDNWRPQWFLDIELPDGSVSQVILRGYRNPGYTAVDTAGVRKTLAEEAEVLRAMQDMPISVPRYYGYNAEHGWMLMERVEGEAELSSVTDPDRRFALFQSYLEDIARLHACPLDKIALPVDMPRPASSKAQREDFKNANLAEYRALKRTQPEPVLELGIQWLENNEISSERPLSFGLGDVGPNQFMFAGSQYKSLIDFEYGVIADPFLGIGMMRVRDVVYSIGRMPEHILHYGKHYEMLTGIPLDIAALRYMTVASTVIYNLRSAAGKIDPDPAMPDLAFLFAWENLAQRGIVEAIAEYYGIHLAAPEIPQETSSMLMPIHNVMIAQIEQYYAARATDTLERSFSNYSAALARTLARGNAMVGKIDQANIAELAALVGHRVDDWYTGLFELERLIAQDYGRDFEARLNFLYRMQMRREYLYEPLQRATGCSVGIPLMRFDDFEGIGPSKIPLPTPKGDEVPAGSAILADDQVAAYL